MNRNGNNNGRELENLAFTGQNEEKARSIAASVFNKRFLTDEQTSNNLGLENINNFVQLGSGAFLNIRAT